MSALRWPPVSATDHQRRCVDELRVPSEHKQFFGNFITIPLCSGANIVLTGCFVWQFLDLSGRCPASLGCRAQKLCNTSSRPFVVTGEEEGVSGDSGAVMPPIPPGASVTP